MNQKGGVGKTTSVVNIASAIARQGRKVGVIDLDPQAHATLHLGIEPEPGDATVYDLFTEDDATADNVFIQKSENLYVLPAETDLAAAEIELADATDRNHRLATKIRKSELAQSLDFILIDCPPSLGLLTLNALVLAREVIVPMQAHFLALQGVGKLLETVSLVAAKVNPELRVTGILLCMYEGQTKLAGEVVGDLEAFFEQARNTEVAWRTCRVLKPAIRRNIKLAECPSFGSSIFEYDAACPGAADYEALANQLIAQWDAYLERRAPVIHTQPTPFPTPAQTSTQFVEHSAATT
jgi:chromosome partitioning protein